MIFINVLFKQYDITTNISLDKQELKKNLRNIQDQSLSVKKHPRHRLLVNEDKRKKKLVLLAYCIIFQHFWWQCSHKKESLLQSTCPNSTTLT